MNKKQPSNLELQVLSILWEAGPLTARDVLERMPDGKQRAYTTILSTLQMLEKKELVDHTTAGNTHIYQPLVEKNEVLRPIVKGMVDYVFGGSALEAVQCFLRESEVSDEELKEIRKLIRDMEKEKS